uniref:Uncharacterized protein n=1 Tax=Candidatus Methanogaster sp. ANME-2c ERB4 TaxID=2759911 RepID=A0A7G9Y2U7_9EURY|nr:hypothetical protein KODGCDNG_00018 [Methanosarcinales archaeon ANME-2c ERB4]QNO43040.1 hypothetical protein HGKCJMEE_00018 [Methanosarcinales archaeon ANME-2c ERB4]QNO43218.1 hypothetical protein IMGOGGGD_00018 [Methanosarcinales archaeon ANME-2c ERB4]QNO45543.1 hypothetical protein MALFCOLD_00018 [Methanosarcinales archaeon ANME-2c ERB4]
MVLEVSISSYCSIMPDWQGRFGSWSCMKQFAAKVSAQNSYHELKRGRRSVAAPLLKLRREKDGLMRSGFTRGWGLGRRMLILQKN